MPNSVSRILGNEVYTGTLAQGKTSSPNYKIRARTRTPEKDWIRCENCHEAIISPEDFVLAAKIKKQDTRVAPDRQALHLFSGIAKCGHCGGNMTRKTVPANKKDYVYLVCMENKNSKRCPYNKGIPLEKFELAILETFNLHIKPILELDKMPEAVQEIPYRGCFSEKLQDNISKKKQKLEEKRRYAAEIDTDLKHGILSKRDYMELKEALHCEINALEKEMESLQSELENLAAAKSDKAAWAGQFITQKGFPKLTREILLKMVEEIRIFDKDRIEIVFQFQPEYEKGYNYPEIDTEHIER